MGNIMTRSEILSIAADIVTKDRATTHGPAENTFGLIARLWSDFLGVDVAPEEVGLMLVLLKVARASGNPAHADNWIDIAGYAACGGELALGGKP